MSTVVAKNIVMNLFLVNFFVVVNLLPGAISIEKFSVEKKFLLVAIQISIVAKFLVAPVLVVKFLATTFNTQYAFSRICRIAITVKYNSVDKPLVGFRKIVFVFCWLRRQKFHRICWWRRGMFWRRRPFFRHVFSAGGAGNAITIEKFPVEKKLVFFIKISGSIKRKLLVVVIITSVTNFVAIVEFFVAVIIVKSTVNKNLFIVIVLRENFVNFLLEIDDFPVKIFLYRWAICLFF
mmetsp:Transcript_21083/g.42212  ORF Transcript_21083/g.42212 Transcript_21083/m.42212 type:complete len:236 (+) Transcript_21083:1166-1873(+)